MKTITITPIKGALDNVPKEHLQAWYEALQTSVKHEGRMCNSDDTAHCCLCVSARIEGAKYHQYAGLPHTRSSWAPITHEFLYTHVAKWSGSECSFGGLNDGLKIHGLPPLTHPQIAEIIMGREVVLEVEE